MQGLGMKLYRVLLICLALVTLGCSPEQAQTAQEPTPIPTGAPIDSAPTPTEQSNGFGIKQAPTDPAARAALAAEAPRPKSREGYQSVTFSELSDFPFSTDENGVLLPDSKVPTEISELNGKKVALSGFLVPIEYVEDKVSGVILVRNQLLCCYGEEPQLNEWVLINVDPPVEPITDLPVTFFGDFEASPDMEQEQVISLYRMNANGMEIME